MNSKQLAATLFPLDGLAQPTFRVQVLHVLETIPNDDLRPIRLQRWADILWRELKLPVFPSGKFGRPSFVVPAVAGLTPGKIFKVRDVPDFEFSVEATDQFVEIKPETAEPAERLLAAKMLERVITDRFGALRHKYWRVQWNLFFRMAAENRDNPQDVVQAFRGLHFSVVFLEGREPWLAADIKTRFFGRKPLSAYSPDERNEALGDHVDEELKIEERSLFIRDNGSLKRSCRFVGGTGKTVSELLLPELENQSIWSYYKSRYPEVEIPPDDEAVLVRDHGNARSWSVPASRLFPIFTTEDDEMQGCSVAAQLAPIERVQLIRSFLADIGGLRFVDREFSIRSEFLARTRSVFAAPALEFGGYHRLSVYDQGIASDDEEQAYNRYRNAKITSLYEHGPFTSQPLPDTVVLFPENLSRGHRESFLRQLTEEIRQLTGHALNIVRQRFYRLGSHARSGMGLLTEAQSLTRDERGVVLAIVVLSERFDNNVYTLLKGRLNGLPSQCAGERTVRRIATEERSNFAASRLRNLALGVITAAGIQPWVLAESLHSDFYVGIDVLRNQVGYTFVYGPCGRRVRVEFGESLHRVKLHEAVNRVELRTKIEAGVRLAAKANASLRRLVVHRDGRWWPSEEQGLNEAVAAMKRDGVLAADCEVCVVEVRKSHLPVRLLNMVNGRGELQNPMPGSYLVLDERQAIITTTGRPGVWDRQKRTASTLLVRLAKPVQSMGITEVAHDVYRLTHLNWNAPEIEISLPATLRWNDDSLRYIAMKPPEETEPANGESVEAPEEAAV